MAHPPRDICSGTAMEGTVRSYNHVDGVHVHPLCEGSRSQTAALGSPISVLF